MSLVAVLSLFACATIALARPQAIGASVVTPIPIILDERIPINQGSYGFKILTGNGINFQESASPLPPSADLTAPTQYEVVGSYSFTHPDGTVHTMTYVAGPGGFVPQSNMIPTPHPIPAYVQEQILFAEEQKRLAALAQGTAPA